MLAAAVAAVSVLALAVVAGPIDAAAGTGALALNGSWMTVLGRSRVGQSAPTLVTANGQPADRGR